MVSLSSLTSLAVATTLTTTPSAPIRSSASASSTSSTSSVSASTSTSSLSTPSTTSASSTAAPSSSTSSTAPTSVAASTTSVSSASVTASQSQSSSSPTPISSLHGAGAQTQASSASTVALTSAVPVPSSTPTQSSSSGFFSNTGAVAGTFTIVSLVGIAGVIAIVMFIARRRRSRSYEEDTEFLDKSPDLSADPPPAQDDCTSSDHAHYGTPPMALATPPAAYYPDHAYAFSPEMYPPAPHPYSSPHPVASIQHHTAHYIYSPEDYDISYPPSAPHGGANMPNPHQFTDVELDSASPPPAQSVPPKALRPSVHSTPSTPKQWANPRFSVDSFYAGIATDTHSSHGRVL